ncbi:hypothetical protein WA588_004383 [Blastocystis sp. NMH]
METVDQNEFVTHQPLSKEELEKQKIEYGKKKKKEKSRELQKRKRIEEAQARDALFEHMTEEERAAWKQARLKREAELDAALAEGVLHGQRIAIDVSYQEKMSSLEQKSLVKQLCFSHNANKTASTHISLHVCGMISFHAVCISLHRTRPRRISLSRPTARSTGLRRFTLIA